jgi:fatty acid desaturase
VLFCQPFKKPTTNQKTRNQETKKLKHQETKKPKKQKTKKHKIAHPKGGSSGRELGLVIVFFLLFFWLLVFLVFGFWFCLAISEKPTANQKTRNQKTKKQKKRLHTPRGGVVAESWV